MDYRTHLHHLKQHNICPFCEERRFAVDENEHAFVLPARAPYHQDHILICPKKHGETIEDFSNQELHDIHELVLKREKILYKKHGELVVFLRQGSVLGSTGKTISHLHRHIVPHFTIKYGGDQKSSDERKVYDETTYIQIQEDMKTMLSGW